MLSLAVQLCHSLDILQKNTNVIELYNLILKEEEDNQHTWYNSGIGTYARPSWKSLKYYRKVLYHKIDLAIAWYVDRSLTTPQSYDFCSFRDFERTVLAAYRWLSDNYKSGDCIFLFGTFRYRHHTSVNSKDKFRVLSWRVSGSRAFSNDRQGEIHFIFSPLTSYV